MKALRSSVAPPTEILSEKRDDRITAGNDTGRNGWFSVPLNTIVLRPPCVSRTTRRVDTLPLADFQVVN